MKRITGTLSTGVMLHNDIFMKLDKGIPSRLFLKVTV